MFTIYLQPKMLTVYLQSKVFTIYLQPKMFRIYLQSKMFTIYLQPKCLQYTVDSCYLEVQGALWNTSRYPYLDISALQNWGKTKQTTILCNLTPEVRDILKILWKRDETAPEEQFFLFSTIFCYLLLDFHVKTGTRFSLRDKQLFEVSEVEIMRVDCICSPKCLPDI